MDNMKQEYRKTNTTVSKVNYHFIFCPRYRRKVFLIDGFEQRFKELVTQICEQNDVDILAMECHIDHVHLFVNTPPQLSPADTMKLIKGGTGHILKEEFLHYTNSRLWTRSYFVSTAADVNSDTIKGYVETQKTR
jgi:putative transposase